MRFIHTSDWHLGQMLHDRSREEEHRRFLAWLLDRLAEERADALIVAGDVFDNANPYASAQRMYYRFLADCRSRLPALDVVVVGGNHDSPSRLDAPADLLGAFGVTVVGGLPRRADRTVDFDRLVRPLTDASGKTAAWVVAMPFLRPADLSSESETETEDVETVEDRATAGIRKLYDLVFAHARRRRVPGQAIIATGHCFMVGGEVSKLSEREIQRGNQEAFPADIFPDDAAYVALGHLHKAQRVGGRDSVRYCGSPIPLAMSEKDYRHQVLLVELDGETCADIRELPVPRTRRLFVVPETPATLDAVLTKLDELELDEEEDVPPLVEARVLLENPQPNVARTVRDALAEKNVEVVKVQVTYSGTGRGLADDLPSTNLGDLSPEDVFLRRFQKFYAGDGADELLDAYRELLDLARNGANA